MKVFKTTLILLALCIATTAYSQKTINKTFKGVKNLRINIASGSGIIKKGSSDEVKVTLEYTYDDDDYEPTFDQKGDVLRIKEEFNNRRGNWNNRGKSEWTLEIPDGMRVNINTGSGNLEISGLEVDLTMSSGSGNVDVEGITGEISLNTGSGSISIQEVNGDLRANTGSGNIRVSDAKGDTDINTGSGTIRASNIEGGMQLNNGSGNVNASGLVITSRSSFSTGSGNVDIELGAELNGDVKLSTGSGNAVLDFNGMKVEGKFALKANSKNSISAPFSFDEEYKERGSYVKQATVGSKDIRIDISTGSGSAKVRK